ncbi:lactoferrin/transferrin family TonB-dependent receptor [Otariodibacter oris]|uniref:Hemoglobin/transferrin/lactoferrin receptor protein n=1 Tax=Otariodibacter oris TaxID=1032623 RepID=A0A420XJI5_9PAST|nr:lactoferrin/transferrin family TonB-dependent receptor [Otariodibacter oris]QGM80584.1 hypothetical protein A6A10_03805 [Otariodibacter oris]RKR77260.1 hemoglobin/transferrin/lactoferrin receptor protein [Otariodibacter oris]
MRNQFKKNPFMYSTLYVAIFIVPFIIDSVHAADDVKQLSDVQVTGKRKVNRKDNEVTGLGKIVKTSDVISREQVLGIRDLVRYDPGIAVVEQGRGASVGYSIRGVDKNRVAIVVDGLPQVQSYVMQRESGSNRRGGGSINEVENENIAAIEISKGASSSEYGSGSLGGALGFRTKEPADIIPEGKNWGLTNKSAYSSKNKQFTQSVGFAGRTGGFEGLVQYTHKNGRETQAHSDVANTMNYTIKRMDTRPLDDPNGGEWFLFENDCNVNVLCTEQPRVAYTPLDAAGNNEIVETLSAKDYTGSDRALPDPMKYKTGSWLAKLGYQFNPFHYLGVVFEETKQRYDIRDMSLKSYYSINDRGQNDPSTLLKIDFAGSTGYYPLGGEPLDGIHSGVIGAKWARARFYDENHRKVRRGLTYRFIDPKWVDNLTLDFNNQEITLDQQEHNLNCSAYPNIDKSCRPSEDKIRSFYRSERNVYSEKHNLLKLGIEKKVDIFSTQNTFNFDGGIDYFESKLERKDLYRIYTDVTYTPSGRGLLSNPRIISDWKVNLVNEPDNCNLLSIYRNCASRVIKGDNKFVGLRDNIRINQYLDLGVGMRFDYYKFKSDDTATAKNRSYHNPSWNLGLVFKPIRNISLSYRVSSGFRVPSFQELFGYRNPGLTAEDVANGAYQPSNLEPEKALNNEIGIGFRGNFGSLELSYFNNKYKKLIAIGERLALDSQGKLRPVLNSNQYHNALDATVEGFNLVGKIDWNGIWDRLPEGLYSNLAYNKIKPKSVSVYDHLNVDSYGFDTLQPSRYIASLGYDEPDQNKWGVNLTMTYSKSKDPNELRVTYREGSGTGAERSDNISDRTAKHWYIYDLVGYLNLHKNFTLRAGVYNIMNYRYVTWEALRQSTRNSVTISENNNYARYAAPGRNYALTLEMKF